MRIPIKYSNILLDCHLGLSNGFIYLFPDLFLNILHKCMILGYFVICYRIPRFRCMQFPIARLAGFRIKVHDRRHQNLICFLSPSSWILINMKHVPLMTLSEIPWAQLVWPAHELISTFLLFQLDHAPANIGNKFSSIIAKQRTNSKQIVQYKPTCLTPLISSRVRYVLPGSDMECPWYL